MSILKRARRFELELRHLASLPLVGEVRGKPFVKPAVIDDKELGRSTRHPFVMEIRVDERSDSPLEVGRLVKRRMFPDTPPFVFNVCFSCAQSCPLRAGRYADPASPWFNVFFGYYQLDAPVSTWGRPFGLHEANDPLSLNFEELLGLGKADWNYFSNYLYGVPLSAVQCWDDVSLSNVRITAPISRHLHGHRFALAEIDGVEVVSGYVSGTGDGALVDNDPFFSPIWQVAFGRPRPRPDQFETSFFPVRMRMRFLVRTEQVAADADLHEPVFRTLVYGGAVNLLHPNVTLRERFLDLQMAAVERVIASS